MFTAAVMACHSSEAPDPESMHVTRGAFYQGWLICFNAVLTSPVVTIVIVFVTSIVSDCPLSTMKKAFAD